MTERRRRSSTLCMPLKRSSRPASTESSARPVWNTWLAIPSDMRDCGTAMSALSKLRATRTPVSLNAVLDDDSDFKLTEAMPDNESQIVRDNNERQEALGFLMENQYWQVMRIWSRPWLVTK